ncbi:helix-turn-helix domain-containing protein [Aeromonas veronii]|uniref:Winged helix-turn-helix domain-containing protein n=1 Tax=Aeromonas veronii TaxID=654 RepID=A0A2T4MYB2_AERVE|nr:helix-turn-helix domain-containing protein [Aeromonas veronii]EIS3742106.1 hypothetical protein [Aeromonas hydrophila]PTH79529.1 hypothetical protein DAA48_19700 [Aeromonas veronii]RDE63201.1 hypothetical protein DV708_10275 [Aeromonas veronii]BEE03060.1 hypothetical protein VAWG002_02560 [Aeromonas veronii]
MEKEKVGTANGTTQFEYQKNTPLLTGPIVTGQKAKILRLLRQGPVLGLSLKMEHGISESGARIHYLRAMGFNIKTYMQIHVKYLGRKYQKAAIYVLEHPEWSPPFQSDCNAIS